MTRSLPLTGLFRDLPGSLVLGLLTAFLLLGSVPGGRSASAADCQVPKELLEDDPRLDGTAARFRAKEPLTVVAIGGASTAGAAAGDGATKSYPHQLEETLRARHPGQEINVLNKAMPRQTTQEMVARFAKDVVPYAPSLVIWETGTVDAALGKDVEQFAATLQEGIAELHRRRIEIVLVDMQYNPNTASVINFEPYLDALHRVADLDDVVVFKRFDIMKHWSDTGTFDFVGVPKDQRASLAAEVYRCLGVNLAEAIELAAR